MAKQLELLYQEDLDGYESIMKVVMIPCRGKHIGFRCRMVISRTLLRKINHPIACRMNIISCTTIISISISIIILSSMKIGLTTLPIQQIRFHKAIAIRN